MKTKRNIVIAALVLVVAGLLLIFEPQFLKVAEDNSSAYAFTGADRIAESGSISDNDSAWWVDSGAYMNIKDGVASTIQGSLLENDPWRKSYAKSNPIDTDQGFHPQNIFRLILKSSWTDFREEVYFNIAGDELSESSNRNESNGIFLFGRYKDEDNLYYLGVRVDGGAVIKKKVGGVYYVLNEATVIPNPQGYDRRTNPDILPKHTWIGLRSEIKTRKDGAVEMKLWTDIGKTGKWTLAVSAVDKGVKGKAIPGPAHVGIRTDFLDVLFTGFKVEKLK